MEDKGTCARCGELKKVKHAEIPGPSEGSGSWQGQLCSSCVVATGAKTVK